MAPKAAAFLVYICLRGAGGVRLEDASLTAALNDLFDEKEAKQDTSRVDRLQAVLREVSYGDLFRPVLNGHYNIRFDGGGYLKTDAAGKVDQVPTLEGCKTCSWKITQKHGYAPPKYSWPVHQITSSANSAHELDDLPNLKRNDMGEWLLFLDQDGIRYDFREGHRATKPGQVRGAFFLEPVKGVGGWFRSRQVAKQWDVVKKLPIFPFTSSRMTWEKMCRVGACANSYKEERAIHRAKFMIQEDKNHYVTENKVRSFCDWDLASLSQFAYNGNVLWELNKLVSNQCSSKGILTTTNQDVRQAIEAECFASCQAALATKLKTEAACEASEPIANWTTFFTEVGDNNSQCGRLPDDSLEELANLEMGKLCLTWTEPDVLFQHEDDEFDGLRAQDGKAVCSIRHYDQPFATKEADIIQVGSCPEGTSCRCPNTELSQRAVTSQIRERKRPMFVYPGSALLPRLIRGVAEGYIVEIGGHYFGFGKKIGLAMWDGFSSMPHRTGQTIGMLKATYATFSSFRCANSVGCWPSKPARTKSANVVGWRRACRAPAASQRNAASPVWFMPPPMLKYQSTFRGLRCKLTPCTADEIKTQKVGFGFDGGPGSSKKVGKPNVYNCQPMKYAAMESEQQELFVNALEDSGIRSEYPEQQP